MFLCLFATVGFDLRRLLRTESSDEVLAARLAGLWRGRDDRYSEIRSQATDDLKRVEMSYIGG